MPREPEHRDQSPNGDGTVGVRPSCRGALLTALLVGAVLCGYAGHGPEDVRGQEASGYGYDLKKVVRLGLYCPRCGRRLHFSNVGPPSMRTTSAGWYTALVDRHAGLCCPHLWQSAYSSTRWVIDEKVLATTTNEDGEVIVSMSGGSGGVESDGPWQFSSGFAERTKGDAVFSNILSDISTAHGECRDVVRWLVEADEELGRLDDGTLCIVLSDLETAEASGRKAASRALGAKAISLLLRRESAVRELKAVWATESVPLESGGYARWKSKYLHLEPVRGAHEE